MTALTRTAVIRVAKAAAWERAKGELRAAVAIEAQCSPHDQADEHHRERWRKLDEAVEAFITNTEADGLHE